MKYIPLMLAFAVASAPYVAFAAPNIQVKVENKCDSPVKYNVNRKGSTLQTSLNQRTSTTHSLDVGDKITIGQSLIHTVSAASANATVLVCKK